MPVPPVMLVGAGAFFAGFLIFGYLLAANGGWAKSKQFAVLGELRRGEHGAGAKRALRLALVLIFVGMMLCFVGVGQKDNARREACETRCSAEGYASGKIGASLDRQPKTRFLACICEAPDTQDKVDPLELRADELETAGR